MSAIKSGDSVFIARGMPCCGTLTGAEGTMFAVTCVRPVNGLECATCGADSRGVLVADGHRRRGIAISRLIKLPDELETITRDEEVTA